MAICNNALCGYMLIDPCGSKGDNHTICLRKSFMSRSYGIIECTNCIIKRCLSKARVAIKTDETIPSGNYALNIDSIQMCKIR